MTLGPLEYTVIGFAGNRFNGEIAKEIQKVVDKGIIRHRRSRLHHQGHRRPSRRSSSSTQRTIPASRASRPCWAVSTAS